MQTIVKCIYALKDPDDPPLKGTCSHVHGIRCDGCRGIETVIKQISAEIEGTFYEDGEVVTKRKLQFEHGKAQQAICTWKAHSLRAVNQDLAQQDVLSALDGGNCLIVMNWAMSFSARHQAAYVATFENENEAQNDMDTGVYKLVLERETL